VKTPDSIVARIGGTRSPLSTELRVICFISDMTPVERCLVNPMSRMTDSATKKTTTRIAVRTR
jgi:hypothetical protein